MWFAKALVVSAPETRFRDALRRRGGRSVAVDTDYVFPLPESVSFDAAAALPLNYLTAHFALVRRANLQRGETVLVQGAGGGVGSASCNIAAALGAKVIAMRIGAESLPSQRPPVLTTLCLRMAF